MLRVRTHGRWPVLEAHLVDRCLAEAGRPPEPGRMSSTVVVPSARVAHRVQEALADSAPGGAVVGVRVIDLFHLAQELAGGAPGRKVVFDSDFYVALVEHLVRMEPGRFPRVAPTIEFRGLARALWGTVHELREAGLGRAACEQLLEEKGLGDPPPAWAEEVLRLFNAVDAFLAAQGIDDRAALVRRANVNVEAGARPAAARLLYYGFYELIGLQVDLLHALARVIDVDVYACMDRKAKALAFANDFCAVALSGGETTSLADREVPSALGDVTRALFDFEAPLPPATPPAVWNACGPADEVWAVAKEVLALRDRGVPFREIGVVAPALEAYAEVLPAVFGASRVPFEASCGAPLLHLPYPRAVSHLVRAAREDLPREAVIALLRSPCRRLDRRSNPDAWVLLARAVGVRGGLADWEARLDRWTREDFQVRGDDESLSVTKAQAKRLLAEVQALAEGVASLPRKGAWERHARSFAALLDAALVVPKASGGAAEAVQTAIDALARRDLFAPSVDRETFLAALDEALSDGEAPLGEEGSLGVRVLDLTSARAIPFRHLFVLGMNEKAFPRMPREDPFLRDDVRRTLADTGVCPQLRPRFEPRIQEERTILAWALDAAREGLTLVYQRSDETGRLAIPSTFLHEVRRVTGVREEQRVPRRWAERVKGVPQAVLSPREAASREAFEGQSPRGLYRAMGWDLAAFDRSRKALREVERYDRAGPHDGILGKGSPVVERLRRDGLSPTGLETVAKCPFRFLVERALGLEPLPEAEEEVDRLTLGHLYHRALERYFDEDVKAKRRGQFERRRLRACVDAVFEEEAAQAPTGLPFLWELTRRRVLRNLDRFLVADEKRSKGYRPAMLEHEVEGTLPFDERVRAHGTIDRIDLRVDGDGPEFRVIDYKSGRPPEGRLDTLALKGEKLQLPLYLHLAAREIGGEGEALLAFVGDEAEEPFAELPAGFWKENGEAFRAKVKELVAVVEAGRFAIHPGPHCTWCALGSVCRRHHAPTSVRAQREEGR